MSLTELKKDLRAKADKACAENLQRYFKTGPGEYGEGDIFIGLKVGEIRIIARQYRSLPLNDLQKLMSSKFHEERMIALMILRAHYEKAPENERQKFIDFYLKNTKNINNWDLVDLSAHYILGNFIRDHDSSILYKLAKSKNVWERRIAIMATHDFIRKGQFKDALKLAEILQNDRHDLIHKAVGWTLREVGNRDRNVEEKFLKTRYKKMPRTLLRYAIEKFPETRRKAYLAGTV